MHDFKKDLEYSKKHNEILHEFYKKHYKAIKIGESTLEEDKLGIDKKLYTEKWIIYIDEKIRKRDYGDILLETQSCVETNSIGWALDPKKKTHIIIYYIEETKIVYLIDYQELRTAFDMNYEYWAKSWFKYAYNKRHDWTTYRSENIPVKLELIEQAGVRISFKQL